MRLYYVTRPSRELLHGMSCSELRTLLKRRGYKIRRTFFQDGCIAQYKGRFYRFRWWSVDEFFVDVSCPIEDFDRWANSVDNVVQFYNWLEGTE